MAFNSNYAAFYNLLYENKDYQNEAVYINQLIKKYKPADGGIKLLDLACGTGRHAFELEKLGYIVNGSDISEGMIAAAKEEGSKKGSTVDFYNYSFQDAHKIDCRYDVVISMFSAVNYLTSYADLSKTLSNIAALLKEDGIFIFDYWNGNAVVRDYSPVKILQKSKGTDEIMRISRTELDVLQQLANVEFTCMYFKNQVKQLEFTEMHRMRYYYFEEMRNMLELSGFKISYRSAFLNTEGRLDPYDWNISIIAEKAY